MTDPDSNWSFRQAPKFETVTLFDEINITLNRPPFLFLGSTFIAKSENHLFSIPCKHLHMADTDECTQHRLTLPQTLLGGKRSDA